MTSQHTLITQNTDIPFPDLPNRILLVLLNRSPAQECSDRRYVVQLGLEVFDGKTKEEYLTLVRTTFRELATQNVKDISFLLPRFSATTTHVTFDDSTDWYQLGDGILSQLEKPPRVLGVQCRTLFRKPQKRPMDILANDLLPMLLPILSILAVACIAVAQR